MTLTELERHRDVINAKLRLAKAKAKQEHIERTNRTMFFKPFYYQQKALDYIHDGKKTVLLQGGNRIGKTVFGANVIASACLGKQLWDGKATVFPPRNGRCRIVCSDWEHHAGQVMVPALKEWLPEGSYRTRKNNTGVEAFWEFPETGWTLELMTHVQDTQIHEGWKGHLVWCDEPPPRDKFIANKRGLIDYSGVMILTLTAVSASWILDDIVLNADSSIGAVTEIPMRENPLLAESDIASFEAALTDGERVARIHGGWLNLVGRVIKEFDRDRNVIKPFLIPPDYPCIAQIDLGMSKEQAIGFYAWDQFNRMFVFHEIHEFMAPAEMANAIIRHVQQHSLRLKDVFIDPLAKGDNKFIVNRYSVDSTYNIVEKILRQFGIRLHIANKDKPSGIYNLQIAMKGLNNMPTCYIFDTCKRHIWEIQRWVYDDDGKPKKENDDMMECLYRATLCGIKYSDPREFTKDIRKQPVGVV